MKVGDLVRFSFGRESSLIKPYRKLSLVIAEHKMLDQSYYLLLPSGEIVVAFKDEIEIIATCKDKEGQVQYECKPTSH